MRDTPLAPLARRSRRSKTASTRPRFLPADTYRSFEDLFAFQLRSARVPPFECEFVFAPPRKFRADFAWPEYRLLVEIQGGVWRQGGGAHSHPTNILRDIEKQQRAAIGGWFVMPVTTDEVRNGFALAFVTEFFTLHREPTV